MNDLIQLTPEGMKQLRAELEELVKVEIPDILRRVAEARAHGDLSENAEYHSAKERKAIMNSRVNDLNDVLSRAEESLPNAEFADGKCVCCCMVKIAKLDEDGEVSQERDFQLVHAIEADIGENKLSISSPLGLALMGKEVGDIVDITVPAGTIEYEIIEINYPG